MATPFTSTIERLKFTAITVRASGFFAAAQSAPIEIEGNHYWDGGIVSNTPLWYVLDDFPDGCAYHSGPLFSAIGEIPSKFDQVLEREKDIQYSSKTRFNTLRVKELAELRTTLKRLLQKLPPELAEDPACSWRPFPKRKNHDRPSDQPPPVAFRAERHSLARRHLWVAEFLTTYAGP